MSSRPSRHLLLSGFAALAVVATSTLAGAPADSQTATQSSVSTAQRASGTSGTSSTQQSSASRLVATASTASTSASFRGVGAALADASAAQR